MHSHFQPVDLHKAYRLLNHGPTVLVSASHDGVDNVMAAAWACALDFDPPKVTVVLDKTARTRQLVEGSGWFVLQVPNAAQARLTYQVGNQSLFDHPTSWPASVLAWRVSRATPRHWSTIVRHG